MGVNEQRVSGTYLKTLLDDARARLDAAGSNGTQNYIIDEHILMSLEKTFGFRLARVVVSSEHIKVEGPQFNGEDITDRFQPVTLNLGRITSTTTVRLGHTACKVIERRTNEDPTYGRIVTSHDVQQAIYLRDKVLAKMLR